MKQLGLATGSELVPQQSSSQATMQLLRLQ
jgi:hypothetical protein